MTINTLPRLLKAGTAAGLCLSLAACTTLGMDYHEPDLALSPHYASASQGGGTITPETHWWVAFDEGTLDRLIEEGLAGSLSVAQAAERIVAARATARINGVAYAPTVSGSAAGSASGTADGSATTLSTTYVAGFDASWQIDLFGAGRRTAESQRAKVDAAVEDANLARLVLIAEVARSYVDIRVLQTRLGLARAALEAQRESAELTRRQYEAGSATALSTAQAEGQANSTAADIPSLEASLGQAIHKLGVLIGKEPGVLLTTFEEVGPVPRIGGSVAAGIPAELLRNRPDIRSAERTLASAVAEIGVKEADLYPSLALGGALKASATGVVSWSLAPTLTIPIFNRGALKANVDLAASSARQHYLSYRATVLSAVGEVEDALLAFSKERARRDQLAKSVEDYGRAVDLARELFTAGSASYQELLEAQRALYSAQDALARSQGQVATNYIALCKALGGGWAID